MVIQDDEKNKHLQLRFRRKALETSQRAVKVIADKDTKEIKVLLDNMEKLVEILNSSHYMMQNFSRLADGSKVPNIITKDILQEEEEIIKELFLWVIKAANKPIEPNCVSLWNWYGSKMKEAMLYKDGGNSSQLLDFLLFCNETAHHGKNLEGHGEGDRSLVGGTTNYSDGFESSTDSTVDIRSTYNSTVDDHYVRSGGHISHFLNSSTGDKLTPVVDDETVIESKFPWSDPKDPSRCSSALQELGAHVDPYGWISEDLKRKKDDTFQVQMAEYLDSINIIFTNATFNLSSIQAHTDCLTYEPEVVALDNEIFNLTEIIINIIFEDSYVAAYNYARLLHPLLMNSEKERHELHERVKGACGWLVNYLKQTNKVRAKIYQEFGIVKEENHEVHRIFNKLAGIFNAVYELITQKMFPFISESEAYLKDEITKLKLAKELYRPHIVQAIEDLSEINREMVDTERALIEKLDKARDRLTKVYSLIFTTKLPIINNYNVYTLPLVKASLEINDTILLDLVESLDSRMEETLKELLTEIYQRLMKPIADMATTINNRIDDLLPQLEDFVDDLKEYKTSTKMNTDFFMENFMQVDIFYQELSYEEIEQNIAFEFLSLLGEIGGFLGLLLGASVLTVCELVDYIAMALVDKFNVQQKSADRKHDNSKGKKQQIENQPEKLRSWW